MLYKMFSTLLKHKITFRCSPKWSLLCCIVLLSFSNLSQAQEVLTLEHSCSYYGEDTSSDYYTFEASKEAADIVRKICTAVSLEKNFVVRSSNVRNAQATIVGGKRIILYSTNFLEQFKADARTRWAAYSVLAHEIGHHLNGHDFTESNIGKRKMMELQADRFSGGVLRLLGASLDEAKAGIEAFAGEQETKSHPPGSARREAIASGWKKQDERLKTIEGSKDVISPIPADTDQDGIPDSTDQCPDKKGTKSNKGCPELPRNLVLVAGGSFKLDDKGVTFKDRRVGPNHPVRLDSFYLAKTEVTFDEYDIYCQSTGLAQPNDEGWGRGKNPVINVSWLDAIHYCNWLSDKYGLQKVYTIKEIQVTADWKANGFRLPTEAEWEFAACERGRNYLYGTGTNLANPVDINFNGDKQFRNKNSVSGLNRKKIIPVGSFRSNSIGLYDMSGNVEEWCWDFYGPYNSLLESNPHGPVSGFPHVKRGGGWSDGPAAIQTTSRSWAGPQFKSSNLGFRIARNAEN